MKKIIISIAAASLLLFTGCFVDTDTSTVRINLGNLPIAKVEKKSLMDRFLMIFAKEAVAQQVPFETGVTVVHLGAFDSNNQLLAKKSIEVTEANPPAAPITIIVEFDVPARSGVTIVVLGEGEIVDPFDPFSNDKIQGISHYGNSGPQNLTAGETEEVPIQMGLLDEVSINLPFNNQLIAEWNRVTGASLYKIYSTPELELIHSTGLNYFESEASAEYFLRIEFGFVGKDSGAIYFNLNQV